MLKILIIIAVIIVIGCHEEPKYNDLQTTRDEFNVQNVSDIKWGN